MKNYTFFSVLFLLMLIEVSCMSIIKKNENTSSKENSVKETLQKESAGAKVEQTAAKTVNPPVAEKKPFELKKHNHSRIDPYFWMKDRENPKVIQYLKDENAYTDFTLKPYQKLQDQLFEEMKSRVIEDESSYPVKKNNYFYYSRYIPGQQYPVFARKKDSLDNPEEILIDGNKAAVGHTFYESSGPIVSPSHEWMVFGEDTVGRRFYTLQIKNLSSGQVLPYKIEKVRSNVVWATDNKTFFYTQQDPETLRTDRVFRFNIETGEKKEIFFEKDSTYSVYLYKNLAHNYIFIMSASTLSTEVRYIKADEPNGDFKIFSPREKEHEYEVYDGGDRFFVKTNWKAKNYKLMEASFKDTAKTKWKNVIPHRSDVYFEGATIFKKFFAIEEKKDGLPLIRIIDRLTKKSFLIPFADPSYTATVSGNAEYESNIVRFEFESLRQPESTFDYDMITRKQELKKTRQIPNYNPENYRTERIWVKARDGKKIPVSLLMKKDFKPNGQSPMLIYAYGSYGSSMTPWYSQSLSSLIDRGFVYALAHIRGGAELGRAWYDDGRVLNKKNTFNDFIDCTESLIQQNYASPLRVYAMGGSAGGLLMGSIANMRPDLYRGIVAQVPFVDVVTTMLDDSIPLTTGEYDEWGNPNVKKYYDYILSYSPYDNVTKKAYPNMLVTTGLHDSQVQYWEPAKWVAKLRDLKTDSNIILLKTDMEAGHGGASGRFSRLKEKAVEFTFILMIDGFSNENKTATPPQS